jgi:hypothetical protein
MSKKRKAFPACNKEYDSGAGRIKLQAANYNPEEAALSRQPETNRTVVHFIFSIHCPVYLN